MPQSRLIDVNQAATTYRRHSLNSLQMKKYDDCYGSLYSMNGLLPAEYRVKISTPQYLKETTPKTMVRCPDNQCARETLLSEVKTTNKLSSLFDSILSSAKQVKLWTCPRCHEDWDMLKTQIINYRNPEPTLYKVVPKPPERHEGLSDKASFHIKVSHWVWNFLTEWEAQMAQFRDDNWNRESSEDFEVTDGGETE